MTTTQKFENLNGQEVNREVLENLVTEAKEENNIEIVYRLSQILLNHPKAQTFEIEVKKYQQPATALNAPRHQGNYKEALTEKGKLKKGWKFQNGKIVKVTRTTKTSVTKITIDADVLAGLEYIQEDDSELQNGLGKAVSPQQIYQMVTDKIVKQIEEFKDDEWEKTWQASGYKFAYNFVSKKPYQSINQAVLSNFYNGALLENPYFLTFKQIENLKGRVRKGARAEQVTYYTILYSFKQEKPKLEYASYDSKKFYNWVKENKNFINVLKEGYRDKKGSQTKEHLYSFVDNCKVPILKYYNVFNGADVEGIDFDLENFNGVGYIKAQEKPNEPIAACEAIIENYPTPQPKLVISNSDRAYYRRTDDLVNMPERKFFKHSQAYYTTLFHEYIHSTGSPDRLKRVKGTKFGDKDYSFEELIAEIGASFLCANGGILHYTLRNGAAYIKGWHEVLIKHLKKDNKFIFKAATQAQKATEFILQPDENGEPKFLKEMLKGKKEEKVCECKETKPTQNENFYNDLKEVMFSKNDIPYDVAYRAHTGTSMFPKKRVEFVRSDYFKHMVDVYELNNKLAKKYKQEDLFLTKFKNYKERYLQKYLDYLRSRHGLISSFITGAAKFPIRKMESQNKNVDRKLAEVAEFQKKNSVFIKNPDKEIIKTGGYDSLTRLEKKLEKQEKERDYIKSVNKICRSKKLTEEEKTNELKKQFNFKENTIHNLLNPEYSYEKKGVKAYLLTNLNASIRRIKKQIETEKELTREQEEKGRITEDKFNGGVLITDRLINKIQILFDEKPSIEIRSFIKGFGHAFKWSPKNGVWQRQLNTYSKQEELLKFLNHNSQTKEPEQLQLALNGAMPNNSNFEAVQITPSIEVEYHNPEPQANKMVTPVFENSTPKKEVKASEVRNAKRSSLAQRRQQRANVVQEYYLINDAEIAKFLGKLEKKNKESLVITLTGGQGSGKTRCAFRFMNEFAQNYKVGHASIEEHPESTLYWDKVDQYINDRALNNIDNPEINTQQDLDKLIKENDIIVIDSFAKMQELSKGFEVDKDLRKKYDGKLFLVIFQQTADGKMRGGTKSQFDADIVLFTEKFKDYKQNFVYADKNRYQNQSLDELKYSIYTGKLITDSEAAPQETTQEVSHEIIM